MNSRNTIRLERIKSGGEYENNMRSELDESKWEATEEEDEATRQRRQKRRKRRRRFKKIKKPLIIFLLLLLTGLILFARSDFFTIDKVKVVGNSYYTKAQIKEMCGAETKVNTFTIHKKSMVKLLVDDPYIIEAEITRELPDKLIIKVTENEERCALVSAKNFYIVDGQGYVLKVVSEKPKDIPIVKGIKVVRGEKGEPAVVDGEKTFNALLSMLTAASKTTVSFRSINTKNSVCSAYVKENLHIEGIPEEIEAVVESGKLEAVLYDVYEKGINHGTITIGADEYCVFSP